MKRSCCEENTILWATSETNCGCKSGGSGLVDQCPVPSLGTSIVWNPIVVDVSNLFLKFAFDKIFFWGCSEGKSLTSEDEKTYWGTISFEDEHYEPKSNDGTNSTTPGDRYAVGSSNANSDDAHRRLYVQGSVIFGYGLEPQPVGRFIMRETSETDIDDDDEDDEDAEDESTPDDLVDWSNAFQ